MLDRNRDGHQCRDRQRRSHQISCQPAENGGHALASFYLLPELGHEVGTRFRIRANIAVSLKQGAQAFAAFVRLIVLEVVRLHIASNENCPRGPPVSRKREMLSGRAASLGTGALSWRSL